MTTLHVKKNAGSPDFVWFEVCGFSNGFTKNPQSFENRKLCVNIQSGLTRGKLRNPTT